LHYQRPPGDFPPRFSRWRTILQFHENLSDREMEEACRYDLRIKYALALAIDERPFDHSVAR